MPLPFLCTFTNCTRYLFFLDNGNLNTPAVVHGDFKPHGPCIQACVVRQAALSPGEECGDSLGLGAVFSAHRVDAVLQVLAAGVTPAVDGGGDAGGAPLGLAVLRGAADHLPHGAVHVLVLVGVDDGVHDRVEQRQQQEPALHVLNVALRAVQAIEQQHH